MNNYLQALATLILVSIHQKTRWTQNWFGHGRKEKNSHQEFKSDYPAHIPTRHNMKEMERKLF
jgi:hypothetical protein